MRSRWLPALTLGLGRLGLLGLLGLLACAGAGSDKITTSHDEPKPKRTWDLNDVSMLLPHPTSADMPRLFSPSTRGKSGALIPQTWLATVPRPLVVNVGDETSFPALRAIAIRLDPCFKDAGSTSCRPMVRISWQPFTPKSAADTEVESLDAALHSFYDLTTAQFRTLADALWKLREAAADVSVARTPLGPHPILTRQGYAGAYWTGVADALLAVCGEASLTRLTVMQLGGRTNVWHFNGVEAEPGGSPAPMTIARIASPQQTIGVHTQPPIHFDGGLFRDAVADDQRLEPAGQDDFNLLLRWSSSIDPKVDATREMLGRVSETIAFLETPTDKSTSETIDCASCHIAQTARVWIDKRIPPTAETAHPTYDLTNISRRAQLTNQLRAFGYFQKEPVVTRRVILESAAVADAMRAL
jgi:hypothetical protein